MPQVDVRKEFKHGLDGGEPPKNSLKTALGAYEPKKQEPLPAWHLERRRNGFVKEIRQTLIKSPGLSNGLAKCDGQKVGQTISMPTILDVKWIQPRFL